MVGVAATVAVAILVLVRQSATVAVPVPDPDRTLRAVIRVRALPVIAITMMTAVTHDHTVVNRTKDVCFFGVVFVHYLI